MRRSSAAGVGDVGKGEIVGVARRVGVEPGRAAKLTVPQPGLRHLRGGQNEAQVEGDVLARRKDQRLPQPVARGAVVEKAC